MNSERSDPPVTLPPLLPLDEGQLFQKGSAQDGNHMPNTVALQRHLQAGGALAEADALALITSATAIFAQEPNVLHLDDPITISGDIHGQFYDLLTLLQLGGDPSEAQYLFLGDYVDRGIFSCEVALLLLAFKIRYPKRFWMLRGNHECRRLSSHFTFRDECVQKYGAAVYDAFQSAFDHLPLAAVVSKSFLCVHGGISPYISTLGDIDTIARMREPPMSGPMCDLLWSDPMEDNEEQMFPDALFLENESRSCSFVYSSRAVEHFLETNHLLCLIRAHQAQDEGFRMFRKVEETGFPSVISIFSAPNYCDSYGNRGSILKIDQKLLHVVQYNAVPHPYRLPNFMNAFSWSLPFMYDRLESIFLGLITCGESETSTE